MKTNLIPVLLFLFLILFPSSIAFTQFSQVNTLKLNDKNNFLADTTKTLLTEKSPVLAGTLSFIVPGFAFGQLYNEQKGKFLIHAIISLGCITAWGLSKRSLSEFAVIGPEGIDVFGILILLTYATNYVWSVVDAIVSANKINKQFKLQKYRSSVQERFKLRLTLDKNNQIKLNTTLNL